METFERVGEHDLARIESLVNCVGWDRARRVFVAVASIDRRERLRFLTHREAQTMKIALSVLADASL